MQLSIKTIRSCLLLLILLAAKTPLTAGYSIILSCADSLYEDLNYEPAITEYKRYVSYQNNQPVQSGVYLKLALCYREVSQPARALKYIEEAIYSAESDSLRSEYIVDKALILMSNQNYGLAEFLLVRQILISGYPTIKDRARLALSLDYILQSKWANARQVILDYAASLKITDRNELSELCSLLDEYQAIHPKDVKKAKRLSTYLPGLGQAYCKDYRNGLNSLAINAGIGYWFISSLLDKELMELYPIAFLFWKFYQGSRSRAESICEQYNSNLNQEQVRSAQGKLAPFWGLHE